MNRQDLITEEWLRSVGFKWSQVERQPSKHWILWLGWALGKDSWADSEDLGIELAFNHYPDQPEKDNWFCWLRSDTAHRYHRFLHVRYLRYQSEVIVLVSALTGQPWHPEYHWYGCVRTPEASERLRQEQERLDQRRLRESHTWSESEKDETRSGPLREHLDLAIESGQAK